MLWSPHSHQSGAYSPAGLVLSKQWLNPECRHKRQADWVLIHQEAKQVPIQNQGRVRCCSPSSPPPQVSAPFAHITTTPILPSSQFGQFQACISFFSGSRELPALHPSGTHFGNRAWCPGFPVLQSDPQSRQEQPPGYLLDSVGPFGPVRFSGDQKQITIILLPH